ncbi:MAG: transposase [Rhodobacteraceae bacterium HLUCCO07]|nr:MAG: transposase [Rhodobacteraceae bacterium HLUCCO07]
MKLKLDITPDLVAAMAAEVKAGEKAVTAAMREAGTGLKAAWRGQITRESGRWKGQSRIGGGRRGLRRALYMPALVATRHNRQLGQTYQALCSAGKPAKVALTAVMRKLLILANALIRDDRKWAETAP